MLKRVEKINRVAYGFGSYSDAITKELIVRYGCNGSKGNFQIKGEYPEEEIKRISDLISQEDGHFKVYKMWYCEPIKSWRLVFGYK